MPQAVNTNTKVAVGVRSRLDGLCRLNDGHLEALRVMRSMIVAGPSEVAAPRVPDPGSVLAKLIALEDQSEQIRSLIEEISTHLS